MSMQSRADWRTLLSLSMAQLAHLVSDLPACHAVSRLHYFVKHLLQRPACSGQAVMLTVATAP